MIDLCVVSFQNRDQLARLVMGLSISFREYPFSDWSLRIADNGSTDGTKELLEELPRGEMIDEVLFNENIGYARACNQLADRGTGDVIGLLNADAWLGTQELHMIEEQFCQHGTMGVLGPKQRDESQNITHAGIFGTNEQPRHRGWHEYDEFDEKYRDRVPAVTVSGSAYFVRRSVWDALTCCPLYRDLYPHAEGAFLPTAHFYEETWCSYHAHAHGYDVVYDGRISIGHSWHASSPVGSQNNKFRESQVLFRQMCDHHQIGHD